MAREIVSVRVEDHSADVIKALGEQATRALASIGVEAATYAQKDCPVDTGRLRNSIAWAVKGSSGGGTASVSGDGSPSTPNSEPEENSVYIGSNVEYAPYVEFGEKAHHQSGSAHFLKNAATNHSDRYKAIMQAALEAQ